MKIDIQPSIDDDGKDQKIIIQQFMKELCRRDNEANIDKNADINTLHNEFNIKEIQ